MLLEVLLRRCWRRLIGENNYYEWPHRVIKRQLSYMMLLCRKRIKRVGSDLGRPMNGGAMWMLLDVAVELAKVVTGVGSKLLMRWGCGCEAEHGLRLLLGLGLGDRSASRHGIKIQKIDFRGRRRAHGRSSSSDILLRDGAGLALLHSGLRGPGGDWRRDGSGNKFLVLVFVPDKPFHYPHRVLRLGLVNVGWDVRLPVGIGPGVSPLLHELRNKKR